MRRFLLEKARLKYFQFSVYILVKQVHEILMIISHAIITQGPWVEVNKYKDKLSMGVKYLTDNEKNTQTRTQLYL